MKKKLRLLVTKDCQKSCEGCCNKDWDLDSLPIVDDFGKYNEILITGGEPLAKSIRYKIEALLNYLWYWYPNTKLYLYTASPKYLYQFDHLFEITGYTLTIHDQSDVAQFYRLNSNFLFYKDSVKDLSLRLNIFKGVELNPDVDLSLWKIKDNIEWIPNCPLPKDEVFMKMPNI